MNTGRWTRGAIRGGWLAMVGALLMTGCMDDEVSSDEYGVNIQGYTVETAEGKFMPFVVVASTSTSHAIKSVEVYDSKQSFEMEGVNDWYFTTSEDNIFEGVEEINGDYTVAVTFSVGYKYTKSLTFSYDAEVDSLGEISASEVEYVGSHVHVRMGTVEGATSYGFILTPYDEGDEPKRLSNYYYTMSSYSTPTADEVEFNYEFPTYNLGCDYAEVRAFAASKNGVVRESEESCVIEK